MNDTAKVLAVLRDRQAGCINATIHQPYGCLDKPIQDQCSICLCVTGLRLQNWSLDPMLKM